MAEIKDPYRTSVLPDDIFTARTVEKLHRNSDLDVAATSQHHSIGPGANQVASGTHTHDGTSTKQLLAGTTLTGSKGGNAAVASIAAALVKLGAIDNTT